MRHWLRPRERCPRCQAARGSLHRRGCDVERCPYCGNQAFACGCGAPDDDRLPWTGFFAGQLECLANGWWVKRVPEVGWVSCGADDPEALPDFNRFAVEYRWSRKRKRYVRRKQPLH